MTQPGDRKKPDIILQPDMHADEAARLVLRHLFDIMRQNEQGVIQGHDAEHLHDFRVSIRRTRSILGGLKGVFPPATGRRFRKEFSWLGKLTNQARDLDVFLHHFEDYRSMLPIELQSELGPLQTFIRNTKRQELAGRIAMQLRSPRYRKLQEQWMRYLSSPLAQRPAAEDAIKPIAAVARDSTWHAYEHVFRESRAITSGSSNRDLHELRKSCKKLRYLMELFRTIYPSDTIDELIGGLKQLQDKLGALQDLNVQTRFLKEYEQQMQQMGICGEETGRAIEFLLNALHERMNIIRTDFATSFKVIGSDESRRQFEMLFARTGGETASL